MKFHNNILKAILVVVLLGTSYAFASNVKVVKSFSPIESNEQGYKKVKNPQFIDDSKMNKILAKVDKCFGGDDDAKKIVEKQFDRDLYLLDKSAKSFDFGIVKVSKFPLFLLYSSLKLDC